MRVSTPISSISLVPTRSYWKLARHWRLVSRRPERIPHRMPHRRHVPGAAELHALDAQLCDAMHFLHRGGDVAERQAGQADHPLRIVPAELDDEVVVDAQHFRRGA